MLFDFAVCCSTVQIVLFETFLLTLGCNNIKPRLLHYLFVFSPFGGENISAKEIENTVFNLEDVSSASETVSTDTERMSQDIENS